MKQSERLEKKKEQEKKKNDNEKNFVVKWTIDELKPEPKGKRRNKTWQR